MSLVKSAGEGNFYRVSGLLRARESCEKGSRIGERAVGRFARIAALRKLMGRKGVYNNAAEMERVRLDDPLNCDVAWNLHLLSG